MSLHNRTVKMLSISIFMLVAHSASSSEFRENIKFVFSPGDHIEFTQIVTTITERYMGGIDSSSKETVLRIKKSIQKTKSGWDVNFVPVDSPSDKSYTIDSAGLSKKRNKNEITYKLDHSGQIVDVVGFEKVVDGLLGRLPKSISPNLFGGVNIDAMKTKEYDEWNRRIGSLIGVNANIGESITIKLPFRVPSRPNINYDFITKIVGYEKCATNNCIRVKQTYDSRENEIVDTTGDFNSDSGQIIESAPPERNIFFSGSISRLIDPNTMLVYEEKYKKLIKMDSNIPGKGIVPMTLIETRTYEYLY